MDQSFANKKLEDEYDRQTADLAHKRWIKDDKKTVSMEDIMEEFANLS
ncbi:DUF6290 family protein [Companilactobacillus muriivasis]